MSKPVLIGDVVDADVAELRDIAKWFDERGKPMQSAFLRDVANRYEVVFGAYWNTQRDGKITPAA